MSIPFKIVFVLMILVQFVMSSENKIQWQTLDIPQLSNLQPPYSIAKTQVFQKNQMMPFQFKRGFRMKLQNEESNYGQHTQIPILEYLNNVPTLSPQPKTQKTNKERLNSLLMLEKEEDSEGWDSMKEQQRDSEQQTGKNVEIKIQQQGELEEKNSIEDGSKQIKVSADIEFEPEHQIPFIVHKQFQIEEIREVIRINSPRTEILQEFLYRNKKSLKIMAISFFALIILYCFKRYLDSKTPTYYQYISPEKTSTMLQERFSQIHAEESHSQQNKLMEQQSHHDFCAK